LRDFWLAARAFGLGVLLVSLAGADEPCASRRSSSAFDCLSADSSSRAEARADLTSSTADERSSTLRAS
jgi:hypothetical protein